MRSKLEAEDELRAIRTVAAGTGQMRKFDRQQYLLDLRKASGRPAGQRVKTLGDLAAAGLNVEIREPKRG